jgi:6-phospho-3-hexuloisomerase
MTALADLAARATAELRAAVAGVDADQMAALIDVLAGARRIVCHGAGREGLMLRGLAMRLYHLGLDAHVAGEMTCPPVGPGDVLLVSAGPGGAPTVLALMAAARAEGAATACITAQPQGAGARLADHLLVIPAQTMADDRGPAATSVLPMGSLFEGAQFLTFELLVLALRDRLGVDPAAMRARHTNIE